MPEALGAAAAQPLDLAGNIILGMHPRPALETSA